MLRSRTMTKLVTIFGGSGFVGRYIARRMAQAGWRVRVAVRRPIIEWAFAWLCHAARPSTAQH